MKICQICKIKTDSKSCITHKKKSLMLCERCILYWPSTGDKVKEQLIENLINPKKSKSLNGVIMEDLIDYLEFLTTSLKNSFDDDKYSREGQLGVINSQLATIIALKLTNSKV